MLSLVNKRILLGLTGGIAAYKSADLARRLRDAGAEVRVIMTEAANAFITPLTMQAVSGHPVSQHQLKPETENGMDHIELARWADAILVAPATANFIARLAQGRADDLLSTVCLATEAPVAVAPAMNQQMWMNAATQRNINTLEQNRIRCFGPASGDQACGETGDGRMLEPSELVDATSQLFETGALAGLKVVITAGPTWEALDPVRGLSNRSSGKMGYAIAQACVEAGAKTILVSGRTSLSPPERAQTVSVTSAQDMLDAVDEHIDNANIFIATAAVADYRPVDPAIQKIKKTSERLTLELVKNPDILAEVAARKTVPYIVGFAAETNDLKTHAQEKLHRKNIDLIAANLVSENRGFDAEDNELLLIDRHNEISLERQSKIRLARLLVQHVSEKYHAKNTIKNSRRTNR